jgi:hypothetical protein
MVCISSYTCNKCQANVVCDTSGKAGTNDGDTYYIEGSCCCIRKNWGECPKCGHIPIVINNQLKELYASPQDIEDLKRWSVVEKDTKPPIFGSPVDKS